MTRANSAIGVPALARDSAWGSHLDGLLVEPAATFGSGTLRGPAGRPVSRAGSLACMIDLRDEPQVPVSGMAAAVQDKRPLSEGSAYYLYAVVGAAIGGLPALPPAILPGSFQWLTCGGLAALVSVVPLAAFCGPDAAARDPGWVMQRAAAHHAVIATLHDSVPCLPLGFGTLFPDAPALFAWLAQREAQAARFLAGPAARAEYVLQLGADMRALGAWLQSHLPALRQVACQADAAASGRAILLRKQLARLTEAACRAHIASVADAQFRHAGNTGAAPEAERAPPPALHTWRLLRPPHLPPEGMLAPILAACLSPPRPDAKDLRAGLPIGERADPDEAASSCLADIGSAASGYANVAAEALGDEAAGPEGRAESALATGLRVRLTGPFPPYGHARAALETV